MATFIDVHSWFTGATAQHDRAGHPTTEVYELPIEVA